MKLLRSIYEDLKSLVPSEEDYPSSEELAIMYPHISDNRLRRVEFSRDWFNKAKRAEQEEILRKEEEGKEKEKEHTIKKELEFQARGEEKRAKESELMSKDLKAANIESKKKEVLGELSSILNSTLHSDNEEMYNKLKALIAEYNISDNPNDITVESFSNFRNK